MKLNSNQVKIWIAYLEMLWFVPESDSMPIVKMVYHALSKLIHKLKTVSVIDKTEYKFEIDSVEGLAFISHIQGYSNYLVNPVDTAIINHIIGIIDQKTK